MSLTVKYGSSSKEDIIECLDEACKDFVKPKLIIYFSERDSFTMLTLELYRRYPKAICIGSSTYRSFDKNGVKKTGLSICAIESGIECAADVITWIDRNPMHDVDKVSDALDELSRSDNTICLEFTCAHRKAEENVLMTLNSVLLHEDIQIFGGTAGDPGDSVETFVALNGSVYDDACVFCLIRNIEGKNYTFTDSIMKPLTGKKYEITRANDKQRKVFEINYHPASEIYAQELGCEMNELPEKMKNVALGKVLGDNDKNVFVICNDAPGSEGSVSYFARIYEGTIVEFLGVDDYKKTVDETLATVSEKCTSPKFVMLCNCLARTQLYESEGYIDEFANKYAQTFGNYIGFTGYGEQYRATHFNWTSILLVME